ncbi:MAG TPA: 3-hydroxyacyl-CoA dehydrogenase family protein [Ferruginibacter sp.]|nr:3-hydroxyacyl-CoA dehydrogenase family protein [Ferruginibacter sp.]HMP21054.1 3-hydroxyacyl-CoA dehydrogenase family protein [Ferruginibacter sp.]
MTIAVYASDEQWDELNQAAQTLHYIRLEKNNSAGIVADAFFILQEVSTFDCNNTQVPVFIHAVAETLSTLQAPPHVIRINAWKGFLQKTIWEVAGTINAEAAAVLNGLNKKYIIVPDEPGFVAARIIAMIINEAYFALEENVSIPPEIDTALRLGAGYPFGAFEWANAIGLQHILTLLELLAGIDTRYTPCALLKKEATLCP